MEYGSSLKPLNRPFRGSAKGFKPVLLVLLFLQLGITGCSLESDNKIVAFAGSTMGTTFHVKYVSVDGVNSGEVERAAKAALDDVDLRMSTYRDDSELMQFNYLPINTSATVSSDLFELLQVSQYLSRISGGAFDVTVGPLVNLWGFGPEKHLNRLPSTDEVEKALLNVGFGYLSVDAKTNTLQKKRPIYIDLSAIAKGYGVDRVAADIETLGITSYLVEVGGEVRMKGVKVDGTPWRIGVERPTLDQRRASIIISAEDRGIATSGDYRNYYEVEGKRYSHTIDPRTGYPIDHNLVSVTIIDESTALADGLATLFMVLGTDEGIQVANSENIAAYFISKTHDGFAYHATPGFKQYVLNTLE